MVLIDERVLHLVRRVEQLEQELAKLKARMAKVEEQLSGGEVVIDRAIEPLRDAETIFNESYARRKRLLS